MSKHLIKVNTEKEYKEAIKDLEEPYVALIEETGELIHKDDSYDATILIDDWNNAHPEIPVILNDVSWVKGRRCLAKNIDGGVAICYLDENNSKLFHDGVTAAKLDGSMGQWMSDLPEFNIECIEGESDWVKINIDRNKEIGHKSRRVLLGCVGMTSTTGSVASDGYIAAGSNAQTLYDRAIAIGPGYNLMDYETYQKLYYMVLAKYKTRSLKNVLYKNHLSCPQLWGTASGYTADMGNTDGTGTYYESFNHQNFASIFGIENLWTNESQAVYALVLSGIHAEFTKDSELGMCYISYKIYDGMIQNDGSYPQDYREVSTEFICSAGYPIGTYGPVDRLLFGDHGDIIPMSMKGSNQTYYGFTGGLSSYLNTTINSTNRKYCFMTMSHATAPTGHDDREYCGIGGLVSGSGNQGTGRIQYRGPITVIEDPAEFIALPNN